MGSLLLITGPPGAGKTTVAGVLAAAANRSVLVNGDAFFGFLLGGAIEPWVSESNEQNIVVTKAAAAAAGHFALGGYTTVYDGVVGPWFLATFAAATTLDRLDYVILLPPVEVCLQRVTGRLGHGFRDEAATRKMHAAFAHADIAERYVLQDLPEDVDGVVALVRTAQQHGLLRYPIR